jgi:hypothetical protein
MLIPWTIESPPTGPRYTSNSIGTDRRETHRGRNLEGKGTSAISTDSRHTTDAQSNGS